LAYRILIIHDIEKRDEAGTLRWAYAMRSWALQRYAPSDFAVDRCNSGEMQWSKAAKYDLLFNMDYLWAAAFGRDVKRHAPGAVYVVSFNRDSLGRRQKYMPTVAAADWTIINNQDRYVADGIQDRTCCISNGVDTQCWYPIAPIAERPHRVLWTGGTGPRKGKGYHEILQPVASELRKRGFEPSFRPVLEISRRDVMTQPEMLAWYNSGSYVLCTSVSEGTPNFILEAAACGCVPVTTLVGNVHEFRSDSEPNCVIIERSVEGVLRGLEYARRHREAISQRAQQTMLMDWSYGWPAHRAAYFFALFRALLERGPDNVKPFSYLDVQPDEI